jgi:hypothetical protein
VNGDPNPRNKDHIIKKFKEEYSPSWDWDRHLHDLNTSSNYEFLSSAQQKGIFKIDKKVAINRGADHILYKPIDHSCKSSSRMAV